MADAGERSPKAPVALDGRQALRIEAGELRGKIERHQLRAKIRDLPREVAQLSAGIDQAGSFRAIRSVAHKLHVPILTFRFTPRKLIRPDDRQRQAAPNFGSLSEAGGVSA